MEIDPEVAALLNDIPATKLPEVLVQAGWGKTSMWKARHYGMGRMVKPSTSFQPTFEPCTQCGLPVTLNRGTWRDHAGRTQCDGALTEKPLLPGFHIGQSELDKVQNWRQEFPPVAITGKTGFIKPKGPCGATRSPTKHDHTHECEHPDGHFGFHECKVCRHLWH